jgi:hypothetical protein
LSSKASVATVGEWHVTEPTVATDKHLWIAKLKLKIAPERHGMGEHLACIRGPLFAVQGAVEHALVR